jgi:hypothetical protein
MPKAAKPETDKVRLVPVPGRFIPGVPDVAQDVDPETAAELLAYTPAAFVVEDDPEPETEKE